MHARPLDRVAVVGGLDDGLNVGLVLVDEFVAADTTRHRGHAGDGTVLGPCVAHRATDLVGSRMQFMVEGDRLRGRRGDLVASEEDKKSHRRSLRFHRQRAIAKLTSTDLPAVTVTLWSA